jgi:hypothetical protein
MPLRLPSVYRAVDCAGYGPHSKALLPQARNAHAIFWLQLLVSRLVHSLTLPVGKVLHFRLETAKIGIASSNLRRFGDISRPPAITMQSTHQK